MHHLSLRVAFGVAAAAIVTASTLVACGGDPAKATPSATASSTPIATPMATYAANPAYRMPIADFQALIAASDAVAMVEFEQQLPDYWPEPSPQLMPGVQFNARVTRVLAGDLMLGDVTTIRFPGGTIRTVGDPSPRGSGFRPRPSDATTVIQYEDAPFPAIGSSELVFLVAGRGGSGAPWFAAIPEGRLVVDGASLRSPLATSAPQLAGPGSLPAQLSALTLDELDQRVKVAWGEKTAVSSSD